jgi:hypothetical protein
VTSHLPYRCSFFFLLPRCSFSEHNHCSLLKAAWQCVFRYIYLIQTSEYTYCVFRIVSLSLHFYYVNYLGSTPKSCKFSHSACSCISSYVYKNKLHYLTLQKPRAVMRAAGLKMWFPNATTSCSGRTELYSMCAETFTWPHVVQWECSPIKMYNEIPCLVVCLEFWIPLFIDSTMISKFNVMGFLDLQRAVTSEALAGI